MPGLDANNFAKGYAALRICRLERTLVARFATTPCCIKVATSPRSVRRGDGAKPNPKHRVNDAGRFASDVGASAPESCVRADMLRAIREERFGAIGQYIR